MSVKFAMWIWRYMEGYGYCAHVSWFNFQWKIYHSQYYFLMSTVHYLLSGKKQDSQIPILGLWMMPHLIWQLVCLNPVKWILFYKYKVLTSVTLIVFTACSSLWIHVNQDGCHQRLFLKITWLFPDKNYIFLLPKNTSNRQLQHPISQSL